MRFSVIFPTNSSRFSCQLQGTIALLLAFLALAPSRAHAADPGHVQFINGDRLSGSLLEITPSGTVQWQNLVITTPVTFSRSTIQKILLPSPAATETVNQPHDCRVTITNGDTLVGTLEKIDRDTVSLKTSYAGNLKIKRSMISTVIPSFPKESIFYAGPRSATEWTPVGQIPNAWTYSQNALVCKDRGAILRDFNLTDSFSLQFEVTATAYLYLQVGLYAKPMETNLWQPFTASYILELTNNGVRLYTPNSRSRRTAIGSLEDLQLRFTEDRSLRVGLIVDRSANRFQVMLDGELKATWEHELLDEDAGTSIGFATTSQSPMALQNIQVGPPLMLMDQAVCQAECKADALYLLNRDRLDGQIESVANGQVTVKTELMPLTIPLERVGVLQFNTLTMEKPRRRNNDVRAEMFHGLPVTIQIQSITDGKGQATSDYFGQATFNLNAFNRFQFNIYPDPRSIR